MKTKEEILFELPKTVESSLRFSGVKKDVDILDIINKCFRVYVGNHKTEFITNENFKDYILTFLSEYQKPYGFAILFKGGTKYDYQQVKKNLCFSLVSIITKLDIKTNEGTIEKLRSFSGSGLGDFSNKKEVQTDIDFENL